MTIRFVSGAKRLEELKYMTIHEAIIRYRNAAQTGNGEYHDKVQVIIYLDKHLTNEEVRAFFHNILISQDEYDLARIEILKIVRIFADKLLQGQWKLQFADAIANILCDLEDDYLVRQYAALALSSVLDIDSAFSAASQVLSDPEEDINVRHNALGSIERAGINERSAKLIGELINDPVLGQHILRIITDSNENLIDRK